MSAFLSRFVLGFLLLAGLGPLQAAPVALQPGDTVLFYGNSMVERLLEQGELEAAVQLALPAHKLHFRSLAWTGDEVGYRLRPDGYAEHMRSLIAQWPAKVVVAGFGMNESFAGTAGLGEFKTLLGSDCDQLGRLHSGATIVLLSPTAVEPGRGGPDAAARNNDLAAYARVIEETAKARGFVFVDLFNPTRAAYSSSKGPFTVNGLHLNERGNQLVSQVVAGALAGESLVAKQDANRVKEVALAASQKHHYVAEVARPKNADLYYGVRKRPEENAAELPRYQRMIIATEEIVYQLVASPDRSFSSFSTPWLEPMPPGKGHDDGARTGIIRPPAEAMAEFTTASGYQVNLFASEEQFPELKNPVQIAFDARGRLWVVTMPSFPHTVPGLKPEDKIVVLEDTDHDGKADKLTVFADGMDALDGVAFCEQGVIVSEQPRLWLMRDENGDGKADSKRELLRGIDVTDSHHGGMIAADPTGNIWFCDGVFHRSQIETPFGVQRAIDSTTFRLDPHTGRVQTEWQSITPNPWKITFDRYGNIFQMYGDGLVLDGLPLTWTPLGVYHPFSYATTVGYGKGSAAASISSPNFPEEYQQGMASAALLGSYTVSLTKYDFDQGMVRGSGRLDILSSTNAAFRPADVEFGFDGALYVSDFCSSIIGHAQHPMRDPHWDHTHGRIWRVVHQGRPLVKDWPVIEGAGTPELLKLLNHPQDILRHHARIELRKAGRKVLPGLDQWVAGIDRSQPDFEQAALEVLFTAEGFGETRPLLLKELLKAKGPLYRAAAVRMIRYQADRLPDAAALVREMAADPHPRVQMEVVDAVAHLRPSMPAFEHVLHSLAATNENVKHMVKDLDYGTKPAKGRSVPVLEVDAESLLKSWLWLGAKGDSQPQYFEASPGSKTGNGAGLYRTFLRVETAQSAILDVRHGYLDVEVNGVQVLSFDSMWSNDNQVQVDLQPGLNVIDIAFRNLRAAPPAVHLCDTTGRRLAGARIPGDEASLRGMAAEFEKKSAIPKDAIRIQAVPGAMQFSPREIRVKAGAKVHLIFENPDLMMHNLVLIERNAEAEVGALADKLATQSDGLAKGYLPVSPKILQATALLNPKTKAELTFTAPTEPGKYPYICTFPGHWRLMKGVMIVE